jgi:ankyrin repeat protein
VAQWRLKAATLCQLLITEDRAGYTPLFRAWFASELRSGETSFDGYRGDAGDSSEGPAYESTIIAALQKLAEFDPIELSKPDRWGCTPLMRVTACQQHRVVHFLLQNGASSDPQIRSTGKTALQKSLRVAALTE